MPDLGHFHPIVVHFVIALLTVGVVLRLVSLTGRATFTRPAASTLLLLGAIASVGAVKSGEDAHGPAERIPGVREAVIEHEHWGERTRNLFLIVAALEIAALAAGASRHHRRILVASSLVGLAGLFAVYETGEHGGNLVYSYAGGVGTRTGDPDDVERLLQAGLYHTSVQDRALGRFESSARLVDELARRHPDDPSIQLLQAESLIEDARDGEAALSYLERVSPPAEDPSLQLRQGLLVSDALRLLGRSDSARVVLRKLHEQFPTSQAVSQRLERLP